MKRKIIALFLVAAVMFSGCDTKPKPDRTDTTDLTTPPTVTTPPISDENAVTTTTKKEYPPAESWLKWLEWGMFMDEVQANVNNERYIEPGGTYNDIIRYLVFDEIEYYGFKGSMKLAISDIRGLEEIKIYIFGEDREAVYSSLYDDFTERFGENDGESIDQGFTWWHQDDDGFSCLLQSKWQDYTIRFCPLVPEENRYTPPEELPKGPEYNPEDVKGMPIDMTLDHEAIILEKADSFRRLYRSYIFYDVNFETEIVKDKGELIKSDDIKTLDDIRALFSDTVHNDWIEVAIWSLYKEIDGELYYIEPARGGIPDLVGTWYIGYEVTDDKIIGHFAALKGMMDEEDYTTSEYLNNEKNYRFYDIIIQNIDGKYLITDICGAYDGYNYESEHAQGYGDEIVDTSLITNEALKPKH